MYCDFYSLAHAPFHITPDPQFFFLSPSHQTALGALVYGMASRQDFVAIIGEVGVGKTTVLRTYLTHAHPQELHPIVVFTPQLTFAALLKLLCRDLGLPVTTDDPLALGRQLQQALTEAASQGRQVALIIDEAQAMPMETLARLPLLSPRDEARGTPLQIVLVGQPELSQTLQQATLRPLEQRLGVRATIRPLTRPESLAYLAHRLAQVTQQPHAIFTPAALRHIVRHAHGIPRVLNILCTNALIAGFAAHQKPITAALVNQVIAEGRGARRRAGWPLGFAASAAGALLASLLWLAPWQGRQETPLMLSQPPPTQADDRPAGAEASSAASAPPRRGPATAEAPAGVSDIQALPALPVPLQTPRSTSATQGDTPAIGHQLATAAPPAPRPLPPAPRAPGGRQRGAGPLPKAAQGPTSARVVSVGHARTTQRHQSPPLTPPGHQRFAAAPQQAAPVPPGPVLAVPFVDPHQLVPSSEP